VFLMGNYMGEVLGLKALVQQRQDWKLSLALFEILHRCTSVGGVVETRFRNPVAVPFEVYKLSFPPPFLILYLKHQTPLPIKPPPQEASPITPSLNIMKLVFLALLTALSATVMGVAIEIDERSPLIGTLETRACNRIGCCTCNKGYVVACCVSVTHAPRWMLEVLIILRMAAEDATVRAAKSSTSHSSDIWMNL
jgi:hypothetical protein